MEVISKSASSHRAVPWWLLSLSFLGLPDMCDRSSQAHLIQVLTSFAVLKHLVVRICSQARLRWAAISSFRVWNLLACVMVT